MMTSMRIMMTATMLCMVVSVCQAGRGHRGLVSGGASVGIPSSDSQEYTNTKETNKKIQNTPWWSFMGQIEVNCSAAQSFIGEYGQEDSTNMDFRRRRKMEDGRTNHIKPYSQSLAGQNTLILNPGNLDLIVKKASQSRRVVHRWW